MALIIAAKPVLAITEHHKRLVLLTMLVFAAMC